MTTIVTSPFTAAIAEVRDSVVGINNYQMVRYRNNNNRYGGFGFGFGFGFGYPYGSTEPETEVTETETLAATGSGVVVADKYVMTNYHVTEKASRLTVSLPHDDGSDADELDAVLVAHDENLDVAILYCADLKLSPVALGDSDSLQIGDWAICIGNPLSSTFSRTVTAGIVSGLNRSVSSNNTTTDKYGRKTKVSNAMIQIDAAINNGNSGGGMFAVTGELMGIPTLKYSGSTSSGASIDGIGMCIPINSCKEMIEDVVSNHKTSDPDADPQQAAASAGMDMTGKPRMGITMTSLNSSNGNLSYAVRYGIYYGILPNGVYVSAVDEGAPAAAAGIQPGDIIVEVNETIISSSSQIQ